MNRAVKPLSAKEAVLVEEAMAIAERLVAQKFLLNLGRKRLGPPDAITEGAIKSIFTFRQLENWIDHLLDVSNWDDLWGILFSPPKPAPRQPSRKRDQVR